MVDILQGTAYWADIRKPNNMSGKLQLDIGNLDKATVKLLKELGCRPRNKGDDRGDFITIKGGTDYPPHVVDSHKNPLPEPVSIGNGSKVRMVLETYEATFQGKTFINPSMKTIMVTELVSYEAGDDGLDAVDGYVVGSDGDELGALSESPI